MDKLAMHIRLYLSLLTLILLLLTLVALTVLSFSFVGDGLQEALDPNRSR
jgi:ABC-type dipeptide/oligopeptide/nickel transport system permease subunit